MMGTLAEMTAETEESRRATGRRLWRETAAGWRRSIWYKLRGQVLSLADGPERFALLRKAMWDVVEMQIAGVKGRAVAGGAAEKLELLAAGFTRT